MEKPFAASIADADRMIAAVQKTGKLLAINWPLAWYRSHNTTKRLIDEGVIGDVIEVHFYDGNRGPLYHLADKVEVTDEEVRKGKPNSWFYKKAAGGGSLLDYVGYGVTLGSWFMNGEAPIEVTCVMDEPEGLEVDEHSVTVCRYRRGLSKFETRWGTFTDPWTLQPQPKCGFVIVGTDGTIASYDYDDHVTRADAGEARAAHGAADTLAAPRRAPVEYMLHLIATGEKISGPLDPKLSAASASRSPTAPCFRRARSAPWGCCHERGRSSLRDRLRAGRQDGAGDRRAGPALQAADAEKLPAEDRARRGRGHFLRPSRRLPPRRARRRSDHVAHAGAGRGAARTSSIPTPIATDDFESLLSRDDIEVFDITPHPAERVPLVEAALKAGKHVLSQKPFVVDLDTGERLVELADRNGVKLAVNQNGRWAPHFAYMREAVRAGLIGDVVSCHTASTGTIAGSSARPSRRSTT